MAEFQDPYKHTAVVDGERRMVTVPWLQWFVAVKNILNYVRVGSGDPTGVEAAPVGTLWLRTDGGAGTTLYVKEAGTGTAGWAAK